MEHFFGINKHSKRIVKYHCDSDSHIDCMLFHLAGIQSSPAPTSPPATPPQADTTVWSQFFTANNYESITAELPVPIYYDWKPTGATGYTYSITYTDPTRTGTLNLKPTYVNDTIITAYIIGGGGGGGGGGGACLDGPSGSGGGGGGSGTILELSILSTINTYNISIGVGGVGGVGGVLLLKISKILSGLSGTTGVLCALAALIEVDAAPPFKILSVFLPSAVNGFRP